MILVAVLAYVIGLFLGPFLAVFPLGILGILSCLAVLTTWIEYRTSFSRLGGIVIFLVLVLGVVHAHWASLARHAASESIPAFNDPSVTLQGRVTAPIRYTPSGFLIILKAQQWIHHGRVHPGQGRVRILWREPGALPVYGELIRVTAKFREPYGTHNPGGFDFGGYLKRQGIQAVASIRGSGALEILSASGESGVFAGLLALVDRWRHAIYQAAVASLANPALGLFLGMVIGEQSYIETEVRDNFMATGTIHILSISGSHLGLLAMLIFGMARWGFQQIPEGWMDRVTLRITATRFGILVTIPVVSLYALLAGAETATIRSWMMLIICGIGVWFGRERNLPTALAITAFLMLIPHPESVFDISFQLSYLSVGAIGFVLWATQKEPSEALGRKGDFQRSRRSWIARWVENGRLAFLMSLAIGLVTLPLVALYFYQIAWLGFVSNMAVVPVAGMGVIPLGLFSGFMAVVSGEQALPFASWNQWLFEALAWLVEGMAKIPWAEWHVASPGFGSFVLFWLVLLGMCLWGRLGLIRWGGAVMLIGLICWWGWAPRSGWEPGMVRVTFLDVGQGDATFLELPDGQTVLIDGGPASSRLDMGRSVIGPFLWNNGIHRLDYVLATHPQWDHVGGLPWVVRMFPVRQYWSNGIKRDEMFYRRLESAVRQSGLTEFIGEEGVEIVRSGPCSLKILNPPRSTEERVLRVTPSSNGKILNNASLVTRLTCGEFSFLFTADAELEALERLALRVDGVAARVVKIPHHGARSSLHDRWVAGLQAEALIMSVGVYNRYGHPDGEVLDAYRRKDVPIYRTDRDGAVWFVGSLGSEIMTVHTARERQFIPVQPGSGMWEAEWRNWQRIWQ